MKKWIERRERPEKRINKGEKKRRVKEEFEGGENWSTWKRRAGEGARKRWN